MTKLQEKRNAIYAELEKLIAETRKEERAFNDEEKAEYTSKLAEMRKLDEQIEAEEELRSLAVKSGKKVGESGKLSTEEAEKRAFEAFILGKKETRDATP